MIDKVDYSLVQRMNTSSNPSEIKKNELKKVCQQFEAIFMNYLFKSMRATVPDGGLFEKDVAYNIVQSMHDEVLAEEISKSGGIGLANQLYKQFSKYV